MLPNESTRTCTKTFHVFNSWLCVGCYCSAAHSRNMTNTGRYQSCICHQMYLQIMAEDNDLNQDSVKSGWCSPVTLLGWSESNLPYSQSHPLHELHPCWWHFSRLQVHGPHLLRTKLLHSQCQVFISVLKICLRVHVHSSKTLVRGWRQQWVARAPHSFCHRGKNVSARVWQLSPFIEQVN